MKNSKSKLRGKLVDSDGKEVPPSEYDLDIGEEDFCFRLKNPDPSKSGRYKVVLFNDAGEDSAEVDMNFVGTTNMPYLSL